MSSRRIDNFRYNQYFKCAAVGVKSNGFATFRSANKHFPVAVEKLRRYASNIMIKTTKLLPRLLPCLALFYPGLSHAQDAIRPNIIFLISDDHRWDCIGAAGNPNISTPNMDRLAREGVYFKEATIHNPQCMPSRAALLTGLSSHTNGRYSNQTARANILNGDGFANYNCLPEVLAAQGYATAMVGKWHLKVDPWKTGFQQTGTWMPAGAGSYKGAKLAEGETRETERCQEFTQEAFGKSARAILNAHADKKSTQPLFLWLSMTAPHGPFKPNPERATKPYEGKKFTDVLPPTYQGEKGTSADRQWVDYVAAITSVDIELGHVMETLDETGQSSNTVVVFLGDNGFMMGNRGLQGKAVPYEDSIRVPLMVWGPGVFKGKGVTEAVASSLDLPPTFVKLAGGDVPKEWHGRDLSAVLTDGQVHGTTWSVSTAPDYENSKFPGISYRAVRTTGTKLIVWHKSTGKQPEFYDTHNDPEETKNLYANSGVQPQVKELERILDKWMADTGDNWEMKGPFEKLGRSNKNKKQAGDDESDD